MSDSSYVFYVIDPESLDKSKCNWSEKQKESCYEAFELMEKNSLSPKWMKEENCFRESRRRRCYFVFGKFEGIGFEHILSINGLLYGTPIFLAFKEAKGSSKSLPYPSNPLYSLHFMNQNFTFTGIRGEESDSCEKWVTYMGGTVSTCLMDSTNILISDKCDRNCSKYVEMARLKRFVCRPELISETYQKALNLEIFDASNLEYLHNYAVPLLKGMTFCVSGLQPHTRHDIQKIVEANGGNYTGYMKKDEATHLLCDKSAGMKYKKAMEWNIIIVKVSWLADSLSAGYLLPYEKYSLVIKSRTCSTPNTSKIPNITLGDDNISSIHNDRTKINMEKLDKKLSIFSNKDKQTSSNKSIRRKSSTIVGNLYGMDGCNDEFTNDRTIDEVVDRYRNEENSRLTSGLPNDTTTTVNNVTSNGNVGQQIFQGKTFFSLDNDKDIFKSKVEKLGGAYATDSSVHVDYIYFPVVIDTMDNFKNSNGKNKISDLWLISCLEKKSLVDPLESPFYIPLYINTDKCKDLLRNFGIYIYGFNKFETAVVSQCIMACGGKVINDNEIKSHFVTHIITCKPTNSLTTNTAFATSKIVNFIWLAESISNCTLQKEDDFIFGKSQNTTRKDACWLTWHQEDGECKENDEFVDMFEVFQGRMSIIQKEASIETPLRKISSLDLNDSVTGPRDDQDKSRLSRVNQRISNIVGEDDVSETSKISTPSALLRGEKKAWDWKCDISKDGSPGKGTELSESFVTSVIDKHLLSLEDAFLNDSTVGKGPVDFSDLVKELGKSKDNTTPRRASPEPKKRKLSIISRSAHGNNLLRLSCRRKAAKSTVLKSPFKPSIIEFQNDDGPKSPIAEDPSDIQFAWRDLTQKCPTASQLKNIKQSFGKILRDENDFDDGDSSITTFFPLEDDDI